MSWQWDFMNCTDQLSTLFLFKIQLNNHYQTANLDQGFVTVQQTSGNQ